jgi:hypothetical protein
VPHTSAAEVEVAAALILRLVPRMVESFTPEPFCYPPEPDCVPYNSCSAPPGASLPMPTAWGLREIL